LALQPERFYQMIYMIKNQGTVVLVDPFKKIYQAIHYLSTVSSEQGRMEIRKSTTDLREMSTLIV
jgi:hypothetical protein